VDAKDLGCLGLISTGFDESALNEPFLELLQRFI
jgi:hypothetical protein